MAEKQLLSSEELEKATGGNTYSELFHMSWKYGLGQHVEIDTGWLFFYTHDDGTIRHRGVLNVYGKGHVPGYYVDGDSAGWYEEDVFDDDHRYTDVSVVGWLD